MGRKYYAIIEAGESEPFGLCYVEDGNDTAPFDLVSLNRLDKVWESDDSVLDYFVGMGGGDRVAPVTAERAGRIAHSWDCPDAP